MMKDCMTTVSLNLELEAHCFDSNITQITDPKPLTTEWGLDICVMANWMPLRALVFSQERNFISIPCCNFIHPNGYSDDYTLVKYAPVSSCDKRKDFKKSGIYDIDLVADTKSDIAAFENDLAMIVVDVKMGRVIASGRCEEVVEYSANSITCSLNSMKQSGANYNDFMRMVSGMNIESQIKPFSETYNVLDSLDSGGFLRVY
jgi:hypothetical protein